MNRIEDRGCGWRLPALVCWEEAAIKRRGIYMREQRF